MTTLAVMPQPVSDALFVLVLLVSSALVVAGALWFAQVLAQRQLAGRRATDGGSRARVVFGLLAIAASLTLMVGVIPGATFNLFTASACLGCAFLGMVTTMSGYRAGKSTLGLSLPVEKPQSRRRAA